MKKTEMKDCIESNSCPIRESLMQGLGEEKKIVLATLEAKQWNLRKSAKSLNISLPELKRLLRRYGIREL